MDYKELSKYCQTVRQFEVFDALISEGSTRKAANKLGCAKGTLDQHVATVKAYAARKGHSPEHDMTHTVPEGFKTKGVSSLYGDDGELKLQWVKSSIDEEKQQEIMREYYQAFANDLPKAKPEKIPKHTEKNLLNCFTITDYHIGMLAWAAETGDDWDTNIAEKMLVDWFAAAIKLSPPAETALFAQIGDFMHFDGYIPATPTSGHVLDADTRFQKLAYIAYRAIRICISMLLKSHKNVKVLMCDANHDPASETWLRVGLESHYENEPRCTIDQTADTYYCHEHGKTSLFFHHGHKRKPENIDDVFVAKYREVFGRTKHSYAHMGHMHFDKLLETNLMTVEQHRTLAAKDAYASRGGWMSGRGAKVITYHKDYGEVSRQVITPEMLS